MIEKREREKRANSRVSGELFEKKEKMVKTCGFTCLPTFSSHSHHVFKHFFPQVQ